MATTLNFSIKPFKPVKKTRNVNSSNKQVKRILYCKPIVKDDTWYAIINTKGVEGYGDKTTLCFTEEFFDTKNRTELFSVKKDKTGHYIHLSRTKDEAKYASISDAYTTLSINGVFKGYIVKINNTEYFNMIDYVGHIRDYDHLLTKSYSKENEE